MTRSTLGPGSAKREREGHRATKPTKKQTQSVDPALVERSRAALHELPAELAKGERCEIVKYAGKTIGYAMFGERAISFYVPDGQGKIEHFPVASERDLATAMSAFKKAAERQVWRRPPPPARSLAGQGTELFPNERWGSPSPPGVMFFQGPVEAERQRYAGQTPPSCLTRCSAPAPAARLSAGAATAA